MTRVTTFVLPIAHNSMSREAAEEFSPGRKPWVDGYNRVSSEGAKEPGSNCQQLIIHMVFSTKAREPLITLEIRSDVFAYLGGIIRGMHGTAPIVGGMSDHVHLLIRLRPVHAVAEIARVLKANSSRWAREQWDPKFAWQNGYGAFSVSESNVSAVSRYIATQEEHHKKLTFQQEYIAFLKKNKITYDERYIWE